jgi:hypothetical protein
MVGILDIAIEIKAIIESRSFPPLPPPYISSRCSAILQALVENIVLGKMGFLTGLRLKMDLISSSDFLVQTFAGCRIHHPSDLCSFEAGDLLKSKLKR